MQKKIKSADLRVGMHVVMPESWMSHPFLMGRFDIKSRDQIIKITESGFDEVVIDTDRGLDLDRIEEVGHADSRPASGGKKWDPEGLVPPELRAAVHDEKLPAEEKALILYKSSLQLMSRLLDDPKAENIRAAKSGISELVDLVLAQDDTSHHLLRITSHDFYTYTHSVNVGILSILLSKALFKGSTGHDMHELGAGFFLHDLGKVHVDPAIINKPGRLTDEEMGKMRAHPYQSYKMLKEADQLSEECAVIAMQHHEREDGTGYPRRLRGDEIHAYGRICCIADVYDALTAERSYKPQLSPFEALKIMKEEMLHHFHKEIFEKFVMLFSEGGVNR